MKSWPAFLWGVLFALIIFLIFLFIVVFKIYIKYGLQVTYAIWASLLIIYFKFRGRNAKNVHIHHYTIGMIVVSFFGALKYIPNSCSWDIFRNYDRRRQQMGI